MNDRMKFMKLKVGRYNELKVFLPYPKEANKEYKSCIYVTVGIGGDIEAEKKFHELYPECQIFGLDPKFDQAANFSSIGKFIPYGLSATGGAVNLTIRTPKGGYRPEKVETMTLDQIYENGFWPINILDFMTIDVEGAEYNLLPVLAKSKNSIIICQIDLELHGPPSRFLISKKHFHVLLRSFLNQSDFIPVFAAKHINGQHRKLTLINVRSKFCEEKFHFHAFSLK